MFQFDVLGLIPQSLKQQALDALVNFVSEQAKKFAGDELAEKIKVLRSDAAFNRAFEEGLQRAIKRFATEYEAEDEDLAAAIAAERLPESVLQEDPGLLMYYDNALMRAEKEPVQKSFEL